MAETCDVNVETSIKCEKRLFGNAITRILTSSRHIKHSDLVILCHVILYLCFIRFVNGLCD
jgi:hypothetical protein